MTSSKTAAEFGAPAVEELIRALIRALKAFQMYLPNNPMYQRAGDNLASAFVPIWENLPELTLVVAETDFTWDDTVVYGGHSKSESLAWTLFKDGMRVLTFDQGAEREEVLRFLEVVRQVRSLPADADDDLGTLLWAQDFQLIRYRFTDFLTEPLESGLPSRSETGVSAEEANAGEVTDARQQQVREEAAPRDAGIVDVEEFDSTLYFLDEAEVRHVAELLAQEYATNHRAQTLNILLDMLEIQPEPAVTAEVLGILEALLPNLLNAAEFRAVAMVLTELRVIRQRSKSLGEEQLQHLEQFRAMLSRPTVLTQLLQAVDEAIAAPSEADLGELFRELRPEALETIMVWLPRITSHTMRDLLVASAERLAGGNPGEVVRLLGQPDSPALAGTIDLAGRLKLQGAVQGLGLTMQNPEPAIRSATARALAEIGSPGAMSQLEQAIEDPEREVRVAAIKALGARGYRSVLPKVEQAVKGRALRQADLTERMAFFEAYALIAGPPSVPVLRDMLLPRGFFSRKEKPETRACAAMALARLGSPEAREILEQVRQDKELLVRNAAVKGLREMRQ